MKLIWLFFLLIFWQSSFFCRGVLSIIFPHFHRFCNGFIDFRAFELFPLGFALVLSFQQKTVQIPSEFKLLWLHLLRIRSSTRPRVRSGTALPSHSPGFTTAMLSPSQQPSLKRLCAARLASAARTGHHGDGSSARRMTRLGRCA